MSGATAASSSGDERSTDARSTTTSSTDTDPGRSISLVDRRRVETLSSIVDNARQLTDQLGLDGFTMEDLAAAVGVSRRTLFNYVPGKIDAVLGPDVPIDPVLLDTFASGGPTGDLMADVREFTAAQLLGNDTSPEDAALIKRLLHDEPRLVQAVRERVVVTIDRLQVAVLDREGESFGIDRAKSLTRLTVAIVAIAFEEYLDDSTAPLADRFTQIFDTVAELFA